MTCLAHRTAAGDWRVSYRARGFLVVGLLRFPLIRPADSLPKYSFKNLKVMEQPGFEIFEYSTFFYFFCLWESRKVLNLSLFY